jgi:hypothetical protein
MDNIKEKCILGYRVTRKRLRESIRRIDPEGTWFRKQKRIKRVEYSVPGPFALWHIDGCHKLIKYVFYIPTISYLRVLLICRYKLVVHGCIDGFSRLIIYLHCANNNRAQTVERQFLTAVKKWKRYPLAVRSDYGGENMGVAHIMKEDVGPESYIAGPSTRNQRIERFWRDNSCKYFLLVNLWLNK